MANPVTKIYQLETLGFPQVDKELKAVAKDFEAIKAAKKSAETNFASSKVLSDVAKYDDELRKLLVTEQELRVKMQQLQNEEKAENILRQQAINAEKDRAKALKDSSGFYFRLTKDIRELGTAIKSVQNQGDVVTFRGQQFEFDAAIKKLQELTAAEQAFRRQFAADRTLVGEYTTGIVNAFKQMGLDDLIAGQVTKTQDRLNSLNSSFNELQQELKETQKAGQQTDSIEKQMIDNRNEVIKLDTELSRLRTDLRGVGDVGNQINASLKKGFSNVKGQLSSLLVQYIGVQAAISAAQSGIQDAKISSDQFTDLEIQLNNDKEAADKLNTALKELDTRTTLTGLQAIADVALKAGVTSENIAAVTEAIDKTKVAFGKDFGSVEQGTETFAKLINIFFDDGQITGDRILKIGNSIRSLANETVASVPFLTDFSGRLAGLRQISSITLPDILGLGAGFEEFKQSAEVSSTVLLKVIPKLAADTEKFAEVAGLTNEEFTQLINNNPAEALIRVSEALVKSGKDITTVSDALADSELGSGRITTIIGTLGGKADIFRQRIARAGETIQETGAITDAFRKKNDNLAASLDKSNKRLSDFFASKGFQTFISSILVGLGLLIQSLPVLIGLVGLLTVNWIAQNAALLALRAQVIFYNLAIGANIILLNALRVANLAYLAVMFLVNNGLRLVTAAMRLFGVATAAATGPLGVLLAVAGLLLTAFKAFGGAFSSASNQLSEYNQKLKLTRDITRDVMRATSDQIAQARLLVSVVKDVTISEETRLANLKKLIDIDPIFQKALVDGKINYEKLNEALNDYNNNLIRSAELEALTARAKRENAKLTDLQIKKQDIETAISTKNFSQLEEETLNLITTKIETTKGPFEIPGKDAVLKAARQVVKDLDAAALEQKNSIERIEDLYKEKTKNLVDLNVKTQEELNATTPKVVAFEIDIPKLEHELELLNKQINEFKGVQKDLDNLIAERNKKQALLDKLLNKQKGGGRGGSKLSGEQKDLLKDIDAVRDEELARLNESFLRKTEFQRRETDLLRESQDGRLELVRGHQSVLISDEEKFLLEQLEINTNAIDKKLALLKGANAEERKQIAELNLEKIKIEQDTNDKIFDIRANLLKQQLDNEVKNTIEVVTKIKEDPNVNQKDKEQAQLDADNAILAATIKFNQQMDQLEKDRNKISKKNAEDRAREVREIERKINEDLLRLALARIQDEKDTGEKLLAEFKTIINKQREAILKSNKTPLQKQEALKELDRQDEFGTIARQIAALEAQKEDEKKLLAEKRITEEEYAKFYADYVQKLKELNDLLANQQAQSTDLQSLLTNSLSKLFGFKQGSAQAKLFAQTVAESFQLAATAMESFYDREHAQIERSLELNNKRLEIERDQMLARAQSKEEEESINRQFAAKKEAADREAFEKNKKIQREQAKVNLAIQLSNLAVIAFAPNPANILTLGIAGAIMYAVQAAIAVANYAMNISRINSAQLEKGGLLGDTFETGGQPGKRKSPYRRSVDRMRNMTSPSRNTGDVPTRGGKFKGKRHKDGGTPFKFKGSHYEAEVDELAVIRTRNAPKDKKFKVEGTQMQIASAINRIGGGIDFKPGATIKKFETGGFMGQSLQAPIFQPASSTVVNNKADNTELLEKFDELIKSNNENKAAVNNWQRDLKVTQVTRTVTDAQNKQVRQQNIGTL